MKQVRAVEFKPGTREELLPEFDISFPCISTVYNLSSGAGAPWHWHGAVELFYIEKGCLEYRTAGSRVVFEAGSGGFVNSGVLHSTFAAQASRGDRQLLHLFDPLLISGTRGSRIEEKYVLPLTAGGVEILHLSPDVPEQAALLEKLRQSFTLSPDRPAYEIKLRSALSEIWLGLLAQTPAASTEGGSQIRSERLKQMLAHIHDNYGRKLCASDVAQAAHISERSCFELFRSCLHTTPMEYIRTYRLGRARELLSGTELSVAEIAEVCGLGNGSYFARVFREETNTSPLEYRKRNKEGV